MTDDQNVSSLSALPRTQQLLAAAGTTFSNNFVSYPLCCPSRATYLTGQYPHNHGVMGNSPPDGGYSMLRGGETVPVWLSRAGYQTAHVGKYLNGYGKQQSKVTGGPSAPYVPDGGTDWMGSIAKRRPGGAPTWWCGKPAPAPVGGC